MTTRAAGVRPMGVAALWLALGGAVAQTTPPSSVSEATANSVLSPAAAVPVARAASAAGGSVWLRPRAGEWTSLRVIELPLEPQAGPRARKHHALTWRNDTLSKSLGNAGLGGAECQNRVRLPSRLRASPDGGAALDVQLQVAIGCSF